MSENSQENLPNPLDLVYFFQLQNQLQVINDSANFKKNENDVFVKVSNVMKAQGGTTEVSEPAKITDIDNYVRAKRNLREIQKTYYENNNTDEFALKETLRSFIAVFLNGLIFISSPFFNFQPIPVSSQELISQFSENIFLQDEGVDKFIVEEINKIIGTTFSKWTRESLLKELDSGIKDFVEKRKLRSQENIDALKNLCNLLLDNQPLVPKIEQKDISEFVANVKALKSYKVGIFAKTKDLENDLCKLIYTQPNFQSLSAIRAQINSDRNLDPNDKNQILTALENLESFVTRHKLLNFKLKGNLQEFGPEKQGLTEFLKQIMLKSNDEENLEKIRDTFKLKYALSDEKFDDLKKAFENEYPVKTKRYSFR